MQVQPLSTYSVFGEKNVSLEDGKSLKIFKVPDFEKWVSPSMGRQPRRMKPQSGESAGVTSRILRTGVEA
jgi:hypothetical protein